ncbi:MAG: bacillithiol system redox-active protein YtxJ [Flavobacteriales bacterium]|jgi:bacillithiol system protein YtxJ|nr:bacillithiol system redox-active protein YtxJ [Flavobacteriales bacterium]
MGWFSFGNKEGDSEKLNWIKLNEVSQLDEIEKRSNEQPVIIFKHSTRCSISAMALNRVETNWQINPEEADVYFLDLLAYRPISNEIESKFGVEHQSPQVLVIKDGQCTYSASHNQIDPRTLKKQL